MKYLVSHALPNKFTVVTHELFSDSPKKNKNSQCLHGLRHQIRYTISNASL